MCGGGFPACQKWLESVVDALHPSMFDFSAMTGTNDDDDDDDDDETKMSVVPRSSTRAIIGKFPPFSLFSETNKKKTESHFQSRDNGE